VKDGEREVLNLVERDWKKWQQMLLDMETMVGRNRPGSHHRVLRDLMRGKIPRRAKTDPEFERWVATQSFINPETRNKVQFHSLPAQEQARIRQRWDQQKQEAEGAGKSPEEAEDKEEKKSPTPKEPQEQKKEEPETRRQKPRGVQVSRDKFFDMPKDKRPRGWTESTDGNRFTEDADISSGAKVKNSQIGGRVHDDATVDDSRVHGTVRGSAKITGSEIEQGGLVEDAAVVSRSKVGHSARIRGDTEIHDAVIAGGSWDGQKIKNGRGGTFHQAWDQDTLDILTGIEPQSSVFGYRSTAPGVGDGPLQSMVRYLEDGGRTQGLLGGKITPKKLRERIKTHTYENHDRRDPWLGRGASHLEEVSDEDFEKLMEVAQKEADRRKAERARSKKAMLVILAREALALPELRPALVPLVRLARDFRVASGEINLRGALIRLAYASSDRRVRAVIVAAVRAGDSTRLEVSRVEKQGLDLMPDQYRALVRLAYTTTSPPRRRQILSMLRQAKYGTAFMKWVEKQTFKHPETGNDVKFVSLPKATQAEVHEQWATGKKEWAQKFKPEGLGEATELTPQRFDELKPGEMLWISWSPAKLHKVTGFSKTKTGKLVLEMVQVDPTTGAESEERYLHRSSAGDPKHEIHVVPPAGGEKKEKEKKKEPTELPEPAATWKEMKESGVLETLVPGAKATSLVSEHARGDRITVTSETSGATGDFTVLGKFIIKGDDGSEYILALSEHGPSVVPIHGPKAKGIKIKITEKIGEEPEDEVEEPEDEVEAPKKPKSPPKVGDKLTNYEQLEPGMVITKMQADGPMTFQVVETDGEKITIRALKDGTWTSPYQAGMGLAAQIDLQKWSVGEGPPPPVEEKKPESLEEHKPTGKHKDRKELVGKKPVKKGDASTRIEPPQSMIDLAAPEGMEPDVREKTIARMKDLSLGDAKKLLGHLSAAMDNMEGSYAKGLLESGYTAEDIKKLHEVLRARVRPYEGRVYAPPVLEMANKYDLEAEDADELYDFKADKPASGLRLSDAGLMQRFLAKAKPETRERMKGMSVADFMIMYKSIMAEEDEEGAAEAA
jgi:hypothetical protein